MQNELYEIYDLLNKVEPNKNNLEKINKINELIQNNEYKEALNELRAISNIESNVDKPKVKKIKNDEIEEEKESVYPKQLQNRELEETYIGMLLLNPKLISKFYILHSESFFENPNLLEIYKGILFTEGEQYAPSIAKKDFNFGKITLEINDLKENLKHKVESKKINDEKVYVELKKLLILRKNYLETPIKTIQDKIADIVKYKLYDKMSEEEVEGAVNHVFVP